MDKGLGGKIEAINRSQKEMRVDIQAVSKEMGEEIKRLGETFEQRLKGCKQELEEGLEKKILDYKSVNHKDFEKVKDDVKETFKETEFELNKKQQKFENIVKESVEGLDKNIKAQATECMEGKEEINDYCKGIFHEYRQKTKTEVKDIKETTSKIETRVGSFEKTVQDKRFTLSPIVVQIKDGSSFNNINFDPNGDGEGLHWGADAPEKYETFDDFVSAFLKEYWSKEKHSDVIEAFKKAPWYDRRTRENMREYCEKWIVKSNSQSTPRDDDDDDDDDDDGDDDADVVLWMGCRPFERRAAVSAP
ncbi:uncharacterized protein LOC126117356 [Schistocerca cancellata]|uniref:uncharacterized protein LOC126117356 n=1 Tax=Schistocerca cancellata TaxID=274614 RepID=UPI002118FE06|nr:uncharacterized protein LOC126117356 [Schistocerca cancellata]